MNFEFKLTYKLQNKLTDTDQLMAKLCEGGCTDALVGLGVAGQICLKFFREASTTDEAILSAMEDVKRAVPDAQLIEAEPNLRAT